MFTIIRTYETHTTDKSIVTHEITSIRRNIL